MHRSLYTYAWDLAEEGVASAVDRFRASGLNTVTLAGAYHAGKFLRPHGKTGKVYFPEDGTIYFNADTAGFATIKPVANSLLAERDVLRELCATGGVAVHAWLVLMHNTRLGTTYPEATVRNAFGDRLIYSLCPAAPDARDYAISLCRSVADAYPITGLRLETPGYLPFAHGYHHEFGLVRQNTWLDNQLGLCFCDHCSAGAQKTGIDAPALRARVAERVENYLSGDVDYSDDMAAAFWTADLVLDPDLGRFLQWRCDVVTSLVRDIRSAVRADVDLSIIPSVARPTAGAWYEGSDLAALAAAAGGIEACFYEPSVARIAGDLHDVKQRVGEAGRIGGILRPGHPDLTSAAAVAGAIATLARGAVHDVGFYNYGHLKASALDWIGDAFKALELEA
ncbi:MAG: hypothetical protein ACTSP2_02990 [Alphaproteobacteria bacterium]